MGCSSSTTRGRGQKATPTKEDGTPAPAPAPKRECFLRRMFKRKVKTTPNDNKTAKMGLGRLKKNKVAPMPMASVQLEVQLPKLPELVKLPDINKKLTTTKMVQDLKVDQAHTPKHLVKAGLRISIDVKPNKFGVQYELADFNRPPSRAHGRPGSRLTNAPKEKMTRSEHFRKSEELAAAMMEKEERRKKALEERIARAHRSIERVEKVREMRTNALMEEASLTMTDLVRKQQGRKANQAWTLEEANPRPPTPFRPASRSSSHQKQLKSCKDMEATRRSLRRQAMIKQKQADMARQQAQDAKLAGVRLIQVRSEQSRERRRKAEEEKKAKMNAKHDKSARAAARHHENIEGVKDRIEEHHRRVRYLKCRHEINKKMVTLRTSLCPRTARPR